MWNGWYENERLITDHSPELSAIMSGNNGWSGLNSPSFLKSIKGITSLLLGFPLSSASRIISRTLKGAPPQYLASYLAKYQPQLGSRKFGSSMLAPGLLPQISKAT